MAAGAEPVKAFFFIFLTILCTAQAWGRSDGETIANGHLDHSVFLNPYFHALEDPSGQLTIADILSEPDKYPFIFPDSSSSQLGNRSSTFWIKLKYHLPVLKVKWVISIEYPHLKDIEVYLADGSSYKKLLTTGYNQLPFKHGPDIYGFGFYLPEAPADQTIYLKIKSDSPLIVPTYLHTMETVLEHEKLTNQLRGLFYGIFFVMGAFNLFIFFTTKNESYIYYALYISAVFIFTLSNDGIIRESIFAGFPTLKSYGTHMLTAIMPTIFGAWFCQHILYTKEKLPFFHKLFHALVINGLIIGLIICIFGSDIFPRSVMVLTLLFALTAVSAGIAALIKKIPTARFFCIAWAAVVAGSATWILTLLDILPYNQFSQFSLHMGAACETILLSMALGDRIRVLEQERLALEEQARKQLQESNSQLAANNKFKDEFLSVISHELRTPMNGISGATELLNLTNPTEEQQEYIDTVFNSSNDMLKMVEDILTYTQCEAETLKENTASFNLNELLESLISQYNKRCQQKGVTLNVDIEKNLPQSISTDQSKLNLVLQHVLDNAWKFTDQGEVSLTCRNIESSRDFTTIEIRVSDTGCGVPENLQETVFESFKQADGSLTRKKGGLGIGLALCKRIVEILNGEFIFRSYVDQGTTVTIRFKTPNEVKGGGTIHDERQAALPKLTPGKIVLVVEDNPVNKLVLETLLKKIGLTVHSAINGQEAVDFLANNLVDIVLMDCQMPVMDGFDATRNIRTLETPMAHVPIIAVTANANPGDKLKCLEAGMNDYIKKPISQNILIDKMGNWLASR